MKRFSLLIIVLFSLINFSQAQIAAFKATYFVDSLSQPGLKKYGAKLHFDGINVPVMYKTVCSLGSDTAVYFSDSLPNLSNSSMFENQMTNITYKSEAFNANNTSEKIGTIHIRPFSKNLFTIQGFQPPSIADGDGFINVFADTLTINNRVNGYPPQPIVVTYNGNFYTSFSAGTTQTFGSLYNGDHFLLDYGYWTSVPGHDTDVVGAEYIYVLIGQNAFPSIPSFDVIVDPYHPASSPICNGKARVNVVNSTSTNLFSFDGAAYTNIDSITNLCEGIHFIKVKNANDSIEKYFIVSDTSSVINNQNPYGQVIDTIIYNFTNCNFNYNLPVDSAFLINYNVIDTNTVYFSWQIWQGGVVTNISDTISYTYQTGTSMVSLMIFCGNARTTSAVNFKTYRINDYVSLSKPVGIKNNEKKLDFDIYPNPFLSSLIIKINSAEELNNIEIFNLLGENMNIGFEKSKNKVILNTDKLTSGYYTISIITKSGKKSSYKVIKQ